MANNEKSAKSAVKKVLVFALLVAALSGAVYFNWQYTSKSGSIAVSGAAKSTQKFLGDAKYVNATVQTTTANDYFTSMRNKREQTLKNSLSSLNGIINNVKSTDEAKTKAAEQVARLTEISKNEQSIESLILAKGFSECVAVINDKSISVVVKCSKNGLLASETSQIQDIVTSNSEISLENIKIIEIK